MGKRLTLDLHPHAHGRIERMKGRLGAVSLSEVIRKSTRFLDILTADLPDGFGSVRVDVYLPNGEVQKFDLVL